MAGGAGVLEAPSEVPPIDGDEVGGGASHRRRCIGPVGAFALVGLLAIGSVFAVRGMQAYRRDHLGGTTRTVTLRYDCLNSIDWDQPGSHWNWSSEGTGPERQIVDPERFDTGPREAVAGFPNATANHVAHGRLHFDSDRQATFTSDAGQTVRMHRYDPMKSFSDLMCTISN